MLEKKSLTDIRQIALSLEIKDIFQKTREQLIQEIGVKQKALIAPEIQPIARPEYDSRLMSKPPSKISSEEELKALLKSHTERGLHLSFPEPERWHMQWGKKEDTGTMRQPLRVIMGCAERIMK